MSCFLNNQCLEQYLVHRNYQTSAYWLNWNLYQKPRILYLRQSLISKYLLNIPLICLTNTSNSYVPSWTDLHMHMLPNKFFCSSSTLSWLVYHYPSGHQKNIPRSHPPCPHHLSPSYPQKSLGPMDPIPIYLSNFSPSFHLHCYSFSSSL